MGRKRQQVDPSRISLSDELLELAERLSESQNPGATRKSMRSRSGTARSPHRTTGARRDGHYRVAVDILQRVLALGYSITRPAVVHWLPRARNRIRQQDLIPRLDSELAELFATSSDAQITVGDVFPGYRVDESAKIVLGVLVKSADSTESHIVKLGTAAKVRPDYEGWRRCMVDHAESSRILLQVRGRELPRGRYAVILVDGYQLFGTDPDTESPKPLELVTNWAIRDSKPDAVSVERILSQIFNELERCLYHAAAPDANRATEFYRSELRRPAGQSAWEKWSDPFHLTLRRDAIWLITARDKPDEARLPGYLDPFDYVRWALDVVAVPETLIGRSHGDLHGRNVLVGVQRGEAEHPALFDYGDMSESNVIVWDYVKLETELKAAILPALLADFAAREALAETAPTVRPALDPRAATPKIIGAELEVAERADRMEAAFRFESLLADRTRTIVSKSLAETPLSNDERQITGHAAVDKALCLFFHLRKDAAFRLGFRVGRAKQWRDEYYFSLAVYGLLKAKWPGDETQLEWALISAGVAVAQLSSASQIAGLLNAPGHRLRKSTPSHLVPLSWAHTLWRSSQYKPACRLLEEARQRFPHAVTLNVEHALCLAAAGKLEEASNLIEPLRRLCCIFRDYEALSRLARIYKDSGDAAWKADPTRPDWASFHSGGHPGCQLYSEAFELYREAFEFSGNYFPGINAATLALLTGNESEQRRLAEEVSRICRNARIDNIDERFWVYATEGEAALLRDDPQDAVRFYGAVLSLPGAINLGMLQAVYNQLCRLGWALGADAVRPVIELLKKRRLLKQLKPGPFGT